MKALLLLALVVALPAAAQTGPVEENAFGAWYMYFGTATFGGGPVGAHAEVQFRNHDLGGDLQQLLLRTSARYTVADGAVLSVGYGFIRSEREGTPDLPVDENRIYQEAFLPQRISVVRLAHRFRYEQRFVEDQDFRTRYRYALFATVPLNRTDLNRGAVYAAAYNEVFLNGIGRDGGPVFGQNRIYGALGYKVTDGLGVQLGYMDQVFADDVDGQIQVSLHHALSL